MSSTRRVLVVEDEPSENEYFALAVRGLGFAADCAFDGAQALELAGRNKPDLVLLDALLPKLDGFAVLAELRQRMPDVPVVMMSGIYRKRTYEAESLRMGAAGWLYKPVSVVTVWEILERHLGLAGSNLPGDFPGVPFWRRPLPAVVADLHFAGKTGLLFVRSPAGAAIFFFEDGSLVFARCNDPATRLDRVLAASGRIPQQALGRLADLMAANRGMRLGELLVQEKLATEEIVREGLAQQQRAHLSAPFTWKEGACHFFPTEAPRAETFKMPVDVPPLVFWGCRHLEVDDNLIKWLPRTHRVPRVAPAAEGFLDRLGLSAQERELVALVDGTRPVGALRSIARMLQVDGERILAGLQALQLLDITAAPETAATTGMSGASVPAAGDIAKFKPAMLLVTVALSRRTGVAQLESTEPAGQVRTIWFEDGAIAFASSNDPQDRIGQVLLRAGLLAKEQLHQALSASRERPGVALGRLLVDMGLLGPDDLHRALVQQAQDAVGGLLGWRAGTFQFQERSLPPAEIVPLGLDTRRALMDAFRTCPFSDIAQHLPPPQTRLRRTSACHELAVDLPLTALEDRVLLEASDDCTVQDLAGRAPEGAQPLLRAVHALVSMGLLEGHVAAAAPAPAEAAAAPARIDVAAPEVARPQPVAAEESFGPLDDAASTAGFTAGDDVSFGPASGRPDAEPAPEPAPVIREAAQAPGWSEPAAAPSSWTAREPEPAWSASPAFDIPLDGGLDDSGPALAAAVATATVASAESALPAHVAELASFLEALSGWLQHNPGTVPEGVLALLPADLRALYRL